VQNNRALNPDEFAAIAFEHGWLRPPSAAVIPSTIIMNAIRTHMKRCEKADPPRRPLLAKHQLAGSVVESVLESALHPQAFAGSSRPKGTVYYLATVGKTKWKSPFDGIEVPKPPPRKPAPPKKSSTKENKESKESKESKDKKDSKKGKSKASAPVKIRLVLGAGLGQEDDELSDVGSSSQGSRSVSVSRSNSVTPSIANPLPISNATARIPRRVRDVLDSSSESESSDSDMEVEAGPSRPASSHRSHSYRKNPPPPIAISNSPRLSHLNRLPQASPFRELFFPPPLVSSAPSYNPPHSSPFPSHSLDNTTWAARNDNDRFASFETSSSSSDDEIRDPEWGNTSGILIRGPDAAGAEGDDQPAWTAEDEEAKVKEATEALRVLFPMSSPDEEADMQPKIELNQLDNRVAASDTSSMAETSSTATAQAIFRGQVRGREASTVALAQWTVTSSPVPSPNLRHFAPLAPESSPTQHLSKLRSSFDPEEMDVDEEGPWLDESGELPVRAEDTFSDIDLGSTIGDAPTPEHDFRQKTAAWAREAAASTSFRVKDEPEDYPSPVTTDPDDQSAVLYRGSRASSTDASHTPSSGLSDLPPFEMDQDVLTRSDFVDFEEVIVGPESVTVEEIERWLPANKPEKTPRRGRDKNRHQINRCSGNWGTIGVGGPFPAPTVKITTHAKTNASSAQNRSTRSTRGKKAAAPESPCVLKQERVPSTPPPVELDQETKVKVESETAEVDDAFGTADLEQARVEAEAREEQYRKACKAKAEQQKALLEAYRERMLAAHAIEGPDTMMWEQPTPSPWLDFGTTGPWCSNDSVQLSNPSALSPMVLHSVSALTIGDFPGVMDPRALLSPPIIPGMGVQGVDELMPVYDLDQPKLAAPSPLPPMSAPAGPVAHMPPPLPIISSSAPPTVPATTPIVTTPITAGPPPPSPPAFSPALPTAPIPIPASPAAACSTPTVIVQPSSAPDVTPPQAALAPKPRAEVVGSSASTADAAPAAAAPVRAPTPTLAPASASASASASTAEAASSGKASPTGSSSSSKSASTSQSPSTKPGLVLMPGVTATVLDNIPLYTHEPVSKSAVASQRVHCVCRRLDTDFVNATELLLALGVPFNRHSEFLTLPSPYLAAHTTMPTHGPNGIAHGPGVPGTWVHLNEAKEYVKRLKVEEGNLLLNLLRDDLFRRVSAECFDEFHVTLV
jgi:hypothetical protein